MRTLHFRPFIYSISIHQCLYDLQYIKIMRLSTAALVVLGSAVSDAAFAPSIGRSSTARVSATPLFGYLDDLTDELYSEDDTPDIEGGKKENTNLTPEQKDRYGVGDWSSYVEFDEFDGGDGQMGVAGDGKKGLEKFGDDSSPSIVRNVDKSKARSAKNAWGTSTGYAEKIMEEGDGKVDIARAQQLENWQNQQQVRQKQIALNKMAEDFDAVTSAGDMDWRMLANFGVERNDVCILSVVSCRSLVKWNWNDTQYDGCWHD